MKSSQTNKLIIKALELVEKANLSNIEKFEVTPERISIFCNSNLHGQVIKETVFKLFNNVNFYSWEPNVTVENWDGDELDGEWVEEHKNYGHLYFSFDN